MGIDPGGDAPRLGVGIMANLAIAPFTGTPGAVDYLAVTPDMFWVDRGPDVDGREGRFADIPTWVAILDAAGLPMVSHHIGLSIARAFSRIPAMSTKWRSGGNVGVRIG